MILPVSSCYHNHSFLHFRLTSNPEGVEGGGSGEERGRWEVSAIGGYRQQLARGRKTHPSLKMLKDPYLM